MNLWIKILIIVIAFILVMLCAFIYSCLVLNSQIEQEEETRKHEENK